jgi:2,5-diamino-6-(ribosylamino)-4(3H)-pyrimidinone 5'-phosphate reductase
MNENIEGALSLLREKTISRSVPYKCLSEKMMPEVIVYNAVSIDGRLDHCDFDLGQYYGLAAKMRTEVIIFGSETVVSSGLEDTDEDVHEAKMVPHDKKPIVAVVDGRGRVRCWNKLRNEPYWRDMVALVSESTPKDYLKYLEEKDVRYAIFGTEHVDMALALEWLASEFGAKRVRVDSGGTLNGVLLRQNLVTEVHLLIHPFLVGGTTASSMYTAPDLIKEEKATEMELIGVTKFDGGLLYVRYRVRNQNEYIS